MMVAPQEAKEAIQGYGQRASRAEKCLAGALLGTAINLVLSGHTEEVYNNDYV